MRVELISPPGMKRSEALSQGTRVGDWVFVSGQLAWDQEGGILGLGDFKTQAERAFDYIDQVLGTVGGDLSDVVKLTAYLVNPVHFQSYHDICSRIFPDNPPASTTVATNSLIAPEALVEIEAYAHLGHSTRLLLPPSPRGVGSFSRGARVGNTIWASGQTSLSEHGVVQAVADFSGQLNAVYRNIETVLTAGGASFHDLVKINYFITNPLYYKDLFRIREEIFKTDGPADDVVSIRASANPQSLIEADAIALVPPSKAEFVNPPDLPPPFNFTNVVVADGLVYVSGQSAWDKERNLIKPGDFDAQLDRAFRNVEIALNSVGCGFDNVAKISYFITHVGYFDRSLEIRSEFIRSHPPAITGVVVDSIGGFPGAMCEVDAIAALP